MTWILLVYLNMPLGNATPRVFTQEFTSQETCQAAGARLWEFSSRTAYWSCLKK